MAEGGAGERVAREAPVHLNRDFRILWLSRTLGQTGHQTASFGSLIVVMEATDSSFLASVLVLSWVLPVALVSLVSGSIVDAVSKRWILVVSNGIRAIACFVFILSGQGTAQVFELVLVLAVVGPFIGPAESALVPTLVARDSLTDANAFLNLMRYVAQVAGLAILAPVLTRTAGVEVLFLVTGVLFAAAAVYAALIPRGTGEALLFPDDDARPRRGGLGAARDFLRAHPDVWQAVVQHSLLSATLPLLAALIPVYLVDVLDQRVSDLPVIFLPAVVGMMLGLRLVGGIARRQDPAWLATLGLGLFAGGLVVLASIDAVKAAFVAGLGLADADLGVLELSAESQVAMLLLLPMGFAFSLVNVATTAIINARVPVSLQGRIFALSMLLTGAGAVPPLLAGGGLTEVADVRVVLGLMPLLLLTVWAWARWGRPWRLPGELRRGAGGGDA